MPIDQSQETPTQKWASAILILNQNNHETLVVVSMDGEVKINWKRVEDAAADPQLSGQTWFYAKLLLAVRDGNAKPLPDDIR